MLKEFMTNHSRFLSKLPDYEHESLLRRLEVPEGAVERAMRKARFLSEARGHSEGAESACSIHRREQACARAGRRIAAPRLRENSDLHAQAFGR